MLSIPEMAIVVMGAVLAVLIWLVFRPEWR
jgi:hypothetical protein